MKLPEHALPQAMMVSSCVLASLVSLIANYLSQDEGYSWSVVLFFNGAAGFAALDHLCCPCLACLACCVCCFDCVGALGWVGALPMAPCTKRTRLNSVGSARHFLPGLSSS